MVLTKEPEIQALNLVSSDTQALTEPERSLAGVGFLDSIRGGLVDFGEFEYDVGLASIHRKKQDFVLQTEIIEEDRKRFSIELLKGDFAYSN